MECTARNAITARTLYNVLRPHPRPHLQHYTSFLTHQRILRRQGELPASDHGYSTSTFLRTNSPDPLKPIVLEKPDKFRPPSHPSRLNARSTTGNYSSSGGYGGAYNQGRSQREKDEERKEGRRYPNMFPSEGTRLHWFLTTRWVHLAIALTTLTFLGLISALQSWSSTSPFAHLIPDASTHLPFHPVTYLSECLSVYRLHLEYVTQQTAERRRQGILDAQKRRLYRRSHGMEDLNADEVSGPDVRGLVEWDDGLTNPERERGGVYRSEMIGGRMMDMGARPGESLEMVMARREEEVRIRREEKERLREEARLREEREEEERLERIKPRKVGESGERKKAKIFGVWEW